MSIRAKQALKIILVAFAVYGVFLQWPLYVMGFFGGKVSAACFILGVMAFGYLFSRNSLPETPKFDKFTDKYGKYGCLTAIIVYAAIYILFFRVDEIYFRTFYDPITYCDRFPNGKHIESAMYDVLEGLRHERYFYEKFDGYQKRVAKFCDKHNDVQWSNQIRAWGEDKYRELRDYYFEKAIYPADMEALKRTVEEKYYSEIDDYCQRVRDRWEYEPSAWAFVCKMLDLEENHPSSLNRHNLQKSIDLFLEYHPRGRHALDAYELRDEYPDDEYPDEYYEEY